jgi:hypothetical protein
MAVREMILDGLAWAGVSEPVRVAKISAMLVREEADSYGKLTKTRIKEAVRNTSPPYGRGKAICEQVTKEVERQRVIYTRRQDAQNEFRNFKSFRAQLDTRLNYAYAHAFGRPPYKPYSSYPGPWSDPYERRQEWDEKERVRDKGDECLAITHWQEHVVCLVNGCNDDRRQHIATRLRHGKIVRTYLRDESEDLVQAAISLGGPKVRSAYALGIRVTTDWVGRTTTVHYTDRKEVTLPWQAARYEERTNSHGYEHVYEVPVLINGQDMLDDEREDEELII